MDQPEPDETAYKLSMTDYITYVSVYEAVQIANQIEAGRTLLTFTDVNGSFTYLPLRDFRGMWETSPAIRDKCQEWNDALTEEDKQRKNRWEDS